VSVLLRSHLKMALLCPYTSMHGEREEPG